MTGTVERASLLGDASAVFSSCGTYRYRLVRTWGDGPAVAFVMLNPSTADELDDDPTVRRCVGFARRVRAGGLVVVNLFAHRATDPSALYAAAWDAIGPENDSFITEAARAADTVIAAWGAHPLAENRGEIVRHLLAGLDVTVHHLGDLTRAGQPRHPLYLPADAPLRELPRP